MYPKIFKPEHFDLPSCYLSNEDWFEDLARKAQSVLEAWLKENGKVVYAEEDGPCTKWENDKQKESTHQALLICIEPIKKCEKHEPPIDYSPSNLRCHHCGVKLRPVYEECE